MIYEDSYRHKGMRSRLVAHLQKKGITDLAILQAFGSVPRHFFIDTAFLEHAYEDKAFGIGEGQTISQPYTVAFQTQLLEVERGNKVLEIGTGSGFQSSILAELGARLYSVEVNRKLHNLARQRLQQLNYQATLVCGDGTRGLQTYAPYDRILVTAGAPVVPATLLEQLATGGILVIPVGDEKLQKMLKLVKTGDKQLRKEEHGDFSFVKLKGEKGW